MSTAPPSQLERLLSDELDGVIDEISPLDDMYLLHPDRDQYFHAGQLAVRCVGLALLVAKKDPPQSILDLPSGYGRVLRTLKAAFPDARLTACDVLADAVDFCSQVFGATPIHAPEEAERLRIEERFDLIWCGSLVTHFDSEKWTPQLALFESLLAPGGLLVLTTHGRSVASRLCVEDTLDAIGLRPDQARRVLQDYEAQGFGYEDYPDEAIDWAVSHLPERAARAVQRDGYGIAISSPAWVFSRLEKAALAPVLFAEDSWLSQDVFGCVRLPTRSSRQSLESLLP